MITREELERSGYWHDAAGHYSKRMDCGQRIEIHFYNDDAMEVILRDIGGNFRLMYIPTLAQLESMISLLTGREQACEWFEDDDGEWCAGCGLDNIPTPVSSHGYCVHCGKRIVVKEK
jgi:hypothetical protein